MSVRCWFIVNLFYQMNKFQKYIQLIHHDFPAFRISSMKKIGEGDNSKAFLVNENYIFRFPKRKDVKQQVRREILVLPQIKSAINVQIPDFEFISPEINYVGYKKIEGNVLSNEIFESLKKKDRISIQKTIANFLSQIHSIPLSELRNSSLETMNLYKEYSGNFEEAKRLIYPHISKNKRKVIDSLFTGYLNNEKNFNYIPTIVHNDFSKDHILFDPVNKEITGIIDFGDIAFGDPDYDFMYLLDEFGEDFLNEILICYQHPNRPVSRNKIHFFTLANKIQIVLTSIRDDNNQEIKNALKRLNQCLEKLA